MTKLDEVIEVLKKLKAATKSLDAVEIQRLGIELQTTISAYLLSRD